ncbi:hypothetical protein BLNAU_13109 [Blattamonas nauphoetae]|uniref:Uncharacterized protein n=1 Tax=Blattamonas nauphoetae TaxID=2049346 RepID=A0ABQ9XJV1_9EUKA|nr:hypothetical protein BLNAU_13109 [Blattamonas nauphoetae]
MFLIYFLLSSLNTAPATYYLSSTGVDDDGSNCPSSAPCLSLDHLQALSEGDSPTVSYTEDVTITIDAKAELKSSVLIGPGPAGKMAIKFDGATGGILEGGGVISFNANSTNSMDVTFTDLTIRSYYFVDNVYQTSIIACVDNTNISLINVVIEDISDEAPDDLPARDSIVCIWDGQIAAVRLANTWATIENITLAGLHLGGLSLRNCNPHDSFDPLLPRPVLNLDYYRFKDNWYPQPVEGKSAYTPKRNVFLLSEDTDGAQALIQSGVDGYDGGLDLSGHLEIISRGVDLYTNYSGTIVELTPTNSPPNAQSFVFSAVRGATRELTTVRLVVSGSNIYRCGSNAFCVSPYFNDQPPTNPTWRYLTIIEEDGMERIVAEAKSSDLWPAGKWLVRSTIASVNYIRQDVDGVGTFYQSPFSLYQIVFCILCSVVYGLY